MTGQRRLILKTLDLFSGHPTAEEVYDRVKCIDPTVNLSTVYRTLRWLEKSGFVSARRFDDKPRQDRFDTQTTDGAAHQHFRCRVCNQIIEYTEPLIEVIKSNYASQNNCVVESATLVLSGICPDCRQRQDIDYKQSSSRSYE
ncbi:MAG: transcriptional repressor [Chloroflexi bacterium]|nr:transcriptional repressor [Chloroflexota bacterium]